MNKKALGIFLLAATVALAQTKPTHHRLPPPETRHLDFVKEYVRELINNEDVKRTGLKELSADTTNEERLSTEIYFSKSVQLELRSQVRMLKGMRLAKPFDAVISDLIAFYEHATV